MWGNQFLLFKKFYISLQHWRDRSHFDGRGGGAGGPEQAGQEQGEVLRLLPLLKREGVAVDRVQGEGAGEVRRKKENYPTMELVTIIRT